MSKQIASPFRRFKSRVDTPDGVYVYWNCDGWVETSRVQNVSLGGLFVETSKSKPVDTPAEVDFLVQEGQIRAEAIVRHVEPGRGLGLKFTAVSDDDRSNLISLMNRLRSLSREERKAI